MKIGNRTIVGIVVAVILLVRDLEGGSVLKPTAIDPSPTAGAATITARRAGSLAGVTMAPEIARRHVAMEAVKRGLVHDTDSHDRSRL